MYVLKSHGVSSFITNNSLPSTNPAIHHHSLCLCILLRSLRWNLVRPLQCQRPIPLCRLRYRLHWLHRASLHPKRHRRSHCCLSYNLRLLYIGYSTPNLDRYQYWWIQQTRHYLGLGRAHRSLFLNYGHEDLYRAAKIHQRTFSCPSPEFSWWA